jgi:hypothetical protein
MIAGRRDSFYRVQENETTKQRRTRRYGGKSLLGFSHFLRALRFFVVNFFFLKAIVLKEN